MISAVASNASNSVSCAPTSRARASEMYGSKARSLAATREPTLPSPTTPTVLRASSLPWMPRFHSRRLSWAWASGIRRTRDRSMAMVCSAPEAQPRGMIEQLRRHRSARAGDEGVVLQEPLVEDGLRGLEEQVDLEPVLPEVGEPLVGDGFGDQDAHGLSSGPKTHRRGGWRCRSRSPRPARPG